MKRTDRRARLMGVALAVLASCSPAASHAPVARTQDEVILNPEPAHGPYVVVAVDNHFHDIHPVDDPSIAAHREFIIKNEGFNLHNFSVIGTRISINIKPGGVLRWRHLGHHLRPGTYHVFCKFHIDQGMRGIFTVTK
ncbi:MAG: cupredoxin domain-containing protein [Actinomycetota bacterium]|nr:cupredoxin domain-containing protein [Actinomycetota bacterium]